MRMLICEWSTKYIYFVEIENTFMKVDRWLPVAVHYFTFRLYVQWRFMRGIEAQFLALQKGFNEIIPQHLLKPFDERELEVIF